MATKAAGDRFRRFRRLENPDRRACSPLDFEITARLENWDLTSRHCHSPKLHLPHDAESDRPRAFQLGTDRILGRRSGPPRIRRPIRLIERQEMSCHHRLVRLSECSGLSLTASLSRTSRGGCVNTVRLWETLSSAESRGGDRICWR